MLLTKVGDVMARQVKGYWIFWTAYGDIAKPVNDAMVREDMVCRDWEREALPDRPWQC